jgi:hypothetical protein
MDASLRDKKSLRYATVDFNFLSSALNLMDAW